MSLRLKYALRKDEDEDDVKDADDFKDEDDDTKAEDEDNGGDGEGAGEEAGSDDVMLLQELRHNIEATFRQPVRKLKVKNLVIAFDPETVFGKREQFLPALMITADACSQRRQV